MPSKSLLHDAGIHVLDSNHSWRQASDRRDWMIDREHIDWPDDSSHVKALEEAGAKVFRGTAHIEGTGRCSRDRHRRRIDRDAARRTSSWPLAATPRFRRFRAWTRPKRGRTARARRRASCRAAWSSWAAARPASSLPRSTRASACRSRSSTRTNGSTSATTPGTRTRSAPGSSATESRSSRRCVPNGSCQPRHQTATMRSSYPTAAACAAST